MKRVSLIISFLFLQTCFQDAFAQGPWTQKTSMSGLARHRPFTFSIGNRGYLGCGWNGVTMYGDFWEYDPSSNTWSQKADYPPGPRLSAFGFSVGNKGYAGAGLDEFLYGQSDFYQYDPATNTWTMRSYFLGGPMFASNAVTIGNKGYVCFGDDWDPMYMRHAELYSYDPATDSWNYLSTCPGSPRRDAVGFSIGTKAYFGTGNDDMYFETYDLWEYNSITNAWMAKTGFWGTPRSQAVGFAVNGKGYIGTGGQFDEQDFYEYDPTLNAWTKIDDFSGAGRENSASFVIGNRAYMTCGTSGINYNDLWEFNSLNITRVEEINEKDVFDVYPNPMNDHGHLKITSANNNYNNITYELVNILGKKIAEGKIVSSEFSFDRSKIISGNYTFNILSEGKQLASKKIILQ